MATRATEQVLWIADQWENHCGYPSAVLSGIVPDQRHTKNGGYHCSVLDLRAYGNERDYSNTRPDDKDRNVEDGAAIDMSMSPADMVKCHDRVRRVWADKSDPRRQYINAINTWDGSGDAVRLDFYAGAAKYASPDHKWHDHGEIRRRYTRDWTAARAFVSVLKGESKAAYLTSLTEEDDMTPDELRRADIWTNPYPDRATNPKMTMESFVRNVGGDTYATKAAVARVEGQVAALRAELAEIKAPQQAILAKLTGADDNAIIAAVREQGDAMRAALAVRAEEDAARDAALTEKLDAVASGKLTAEQALAELRELLPVKTEQQPAAEG